MSVAADAQCGMSAPPALRRMRAADAPAMLAIERAAFDLGWPSTAFEREVLENQMARYVVLEGAADGAVSGLLGFAGLWLMFDEAHVVTVAVLPECRGRGFGRLLVHGLVEMARSEEMSVATLECRVSNAAARALYGRYGFYEVGLRKKYYSDNHEDAVIMTTEELSSTAYMARLARLEAELAVLLPGVSVRVAETWD
jgi:ribosomal-protein-alanine N-acetyltransferase